MAVWLGPWLGGRIRRGRGGAKRYVVEKMIDGKSYAITLDVDGEKAAEAELALFLRDPQGYLTATQAKQAAKVAKAQADADRADLRLELVRRFQTHLESGKELTTHHVANTLGYLVWWDEQLTRKLGEGWHLAAVKLATLKELLEGAKTAKRKRAMALKRYTRWLREEAAILHPSQDPTLSLKVEAPAKAKASKGYSVEHVEAVYKALDSQIVRDVVRIHCTTGLHNTEIRRLLEGRGEVVEVEGHGEIAAVLKVQHKKKRIHLQSIPRPTLLAVRRLLARKTPGAPEEKYVTACLHAASKAAKRDLVNYGQLRHSFTTWAEASGRLVRPNADRGVPLNEIAAALGHTNLKTTDTYYRQTQVPPMVVVPIELKHPDDPAELKLPSSTKPAAG